MAIQQKRTRSYVDEVFRQIQKKPGVNNILILNQVGNPIKTTLDSGTAILYAGVYESLREKVQLVVQKLDPTDELCMIRVRTTSNETVITPDGKITILVVQKAKDMLQT